MEIPGKKKGCTKVDDPYFGKRKPSAILKRIHRKISLLESQQGHQQSLNYGGSISPPLASNSGNNERGNSPSLREIKKSELKSRSNENLKDTGMPRQHRASTAPGALSTSSISMDKWPTKEEFVSLLFRMI